MKEFLFSAIHRHFEETRPLLHQLTDKLIQSSSPVQGGRSLGEIWLHLIRSMEYYLRGVSEGKWEVLPYALEKYSSEQAIFNLYDNVAMRCKSYMAKLQFVDLSEEILRFNRPATKMEILLELIEHSVQHRGQILVYYRILGIGPVKIPYVI